MKAGANGRWPAFAAVAMAAACLIATAVSTVSLAGPGRRSCFATGMYVCVLVLV